MKTQITKFMCTNQIKRKRRAFTMVEVLMVSIIDLVAVGFMVALMLHVNEDYSRALYSQLEIRNTGHIVVELQDEIYRADSIVCDADTLEITVGTNTYTYDTTINVGKWSVKDVTYSETSRNIYVNLGGSQYVFTKR